MKRLFLGIATSLGISWFVGVGVLALGMVASPADAEAGCRWVMKKRWRCYGSNCQWHYQKHKVCSGRYGTAASSVYRNTYRNRYGTTSRVQHNRVYRNQYGGTHVRRTTNTYVRTRYGTHVYRNTQSYYRRGCVWRNYRKRYCSRSRGRWSQTYVRSRYGNYWKTRWIGGRNNCYYRTYRRRVCG